MVETGRRPGAGGWRWPWGLLGALLLVAAAERSVARHRLDLAGADSVDWSTAERLARGAGSRADVLCFGTSRTSYGIAPARFREVTGLRALNLAVGFGPPPAQYALLRRALESGARPKAVLVEFHPGSVAAEAGSGPRIWPEILRPAEALGLAVVGRDPGLFARTAVCELLPTARDRDQIRASVLAAVRGEADPARALNLMIRRNKRVNGGALIQPVKDYQGGIGPKFRELVATPWSPSRVGGAYVERFLALAESRGPRVFWLIPPFAQDLRSRRAELGLDRAFEAYARGVAARHRNVTMVDGLDAGSGNDLFTDAVHLNRRGAAAYTEAVGAAVAAALADPGAPRWAALPRFRPASDAGLEDMLQSYLANRKPGGALRR